MLQDQHDRQLEIDDDLLEDLRRLIELRDDGALRALLVDLHESDIADLLQYLEEEERHHLLGLLSDEVVAETVLYLPEEQREEYLAALEPEQIAHVVEEMSTDDAADIVAGLDDEVAEEVLHALELSDREATEEIRDLLRYEEHTAGGRMTTDFVSVAEGESIARAIEQIRSFVLEEEIDVYVLYVTDAEDRLVGYARLQDLVLRHPQLRVGDITNREIISVSPEEDQSVVAQVMQRYDLVAVPVVDDRGGLLGIVTFDDIAEIIQDETSEDMLYLAGVTDEESPATSPLLSMRRRLPWLGINLATAFLASLVVERFEGTIQRVALLAALLPVVAGMGGNAAIQTITVMVRGIALGEMGSEGSRRAVIKELAVGVINGLTMGILAGVIVWLVYGTIKLGLLIFLAMVGNLLVAGVAGSTIPLLLRRLKLDPALSSGPIVTTFTDISGFLILLGLATLTIQWLLP